MLFFKKKLQMYLFDKCLPRFNIGITVMENDTSGTVMESLRLT